MKPLLLLDVDGVLAPFGWSDVPPGYELVRIGNEPDFPHHPLHGSMLLTLSAHYEMVWATARCEEVLTTVAPLLGIGEDWPCIDFSSAVERRGRRIYIERRHPHEAWKLPFVAKWLAEHGRARPVVWVDDDMGDLALWQWAHLRSSSVASTWLYPIRPSTGLIAADVAKLLMRMVKPRRV